MNGNPTKKFRIESIEFDQVFSTGYVVDYDDSLSDAHVIRWESPTAESIGFERYLLLNALDESVSFEELINELLQGESHTFVSWEESCIRVTREK